MSYEASKPIGNESPLGKLMLCATRLLSRYRAVPLPIYREYITYQTNSTRFTRKSTSGNWWGLISSWPTQDILIIVTHFSLLSMSRATSNGIPAWWIWPCYFTWPFPLFFVIRRHSKFFISRCEISSIISWLIQTLVSMVLLQWNFIFMNRGKGERSKISWDKSRSRRWYERTNCQQKKLPWEAR